MYAHLLTLHFKVAMHHKEASLAVFPEHMRTSLLDCTNGDQFTYVNEQVQQQVDVLNVPSMASY